MRSIGTWVDWENSCDRFIAGDPQTEVSGIAVVWQSRWSALREAFERGCNLVVTHEPTFYAHSDAEPGLLAQEPAATKRRFIEETGLVIYRCHDVWDRMPRIGIVDSWAAFLGLKHRTASDEFHAVFESPVATLGQLAEYVACATAALGQPVVEMAGDPNAQITRVGTGCGAITDFLKMSELGADAIIATDDGFHYWGGGSWALDAGVGVVVVNHCVAEEPGIRELAAYVGDQFREVPVTHLQQGSPFRCVSC